MWSAGIRGVATTRQGEAGTVGPRKATRARQDAGSGTWPLLALGEAQVVDLHQVEQQRHAGHPQHEEDEDGLLGGPGDVAVDGVGAGPAAAGVEGLQLKPIQGILPCYEAHLEESLEDNAADVRPQDGPTHVDPALSVPCWDPGFPLLPPSPATTPRCRLLLRLLLQVHQVQDVAQVHQAGGGDEDDLQDPEAQVGDGEGAVIAGVLAAGLLRVAGEAGQLISPHPFRSCPQHQDAENEEDGEPNLPHHRGVLLGVLQQPPQQAPVPHGAARQPRYRQTHACPIPRVGMQGPALGLPPLHAPQTP